MDTLHIKGGTPLKGEIPISGAKNAALPLLAASLLTSDPLVLTHVPHLSDIETFQKVLRHLGAYCNHEGDRAYLHCDTLKAIDAPYDLVRRMRASVLVLGPLLARMGHVRLSLPGGCAIGTRPIDLHLKGMEALGADITLENGYVVAKAPTGGLRGGASYTFPKVTVTGTENVMMAACLATGETHLHNVAQEPEIVNLGQCLIAMGAKIKGLGTSHMVIQGVAKLGGATHRILPDRIEAGTFMMAAALTGGDVILKGIEPALLSVVIQTLEKVGVIITPVPEGVRVQADPKHLQACDITTEPFPGFPTDLQAQFMALMCRAQGASLIQETIFENRFMHVPELQRMGADIAITGHSALVRGVPSLTGAPVMATDLRASVSLILAGLWAQGTTILSRVYHLDRGYDKIEKKLNAVGASMTRVSSQKGSIDEQPPIMAKAP